MRVLCCLLLGWSVLLCDADAQTTKESQAAAVAAIKKMGGRVSFDEKGPGKPVDTVNLYRSKVTDAGLEHLKGRTSLRDLILDSTNVTDAGLVNLKGLTNLGSLSLYDTKVTDAGLEHLKGLTSLYKLDLRGTQVTMAGVKDLQSALPRRCKISK